MNRACLLSACVALAACAPDRASPPELQVGGTSLCVEGDTGACINDGASTRDVAGVHVIYKRVKGEPVLALDVFIDGGDRSGKQLWAETMALRLLDQEGSRRLGLTAWPSALDGLGASVSASMGTSYGEVSTVVPVTYFDDLWKLVTSALAAPADDDYVLGFLKTQTQEAYATELDEPTNAAPITAASALLEGHLLDRFREARVDAQTITSADVDTAWAGMLTKERVWLVVVGDVEWDDVAAKVSSAFAALPSHLAPLFPPAPAPPPLPTSARASVLAYPDAPSWQIAGYFFGPDVTAPDYPAFQLGLRLLGARLFADVRQARGLSYSVGTATTFGNPSVGSLNLATVAPRAALPVVQQTLTDFLGNPVAPEALEAARGLLRAALLSSNRTPTDIANTLGGYQLTTGDRMNVDRYLDALSSVSEDQARRALAQYLPTASLAAAGPDGMVDDASLLAILSLAAPDGGAAGRPLDGGGPRSSPDGGVTGSSADSGARRSSPDGGDAGSFADGGL